jgi:hypothetical protein
MSSTYTPAASRSSWQAVAGIFPCHSPSSASSRFLYHHGVPLWISGAASGVICGAVMTPATALGRAPGTSIRKTMHSGAFVECLYAAADGLVGEVRF